MTGGSPAGQLLLNQRLTAALMVGKASILGAVDSGFRREDGLVYN
jgi:hypothetical protein